MPPPPQTPPPFPQLAEPARAVTWFTPVPPAPGGVIPELPGIQYLRAVAALMVVYFHAGLLEYGQVGWVRVGSYGVDVFFVISGFVMTYTTSLRPSSPMEFMGARLRRIVPLYWLGLAITALQTWRHGGTVHAEYLLLDFSFLPHVSDHPFHSLVPILIPGWTLNFEIVFYILFALGMLLGRWRLLAALLGLVLLVTLGRLVSASPVGTELVPSGPPWHWVAWDFYGNAIALEFGYGILLGQWFLRRPAHPVPRWLPALLLACGLLGLVLTSDWPEPWRWAGAGVAAVPLVAAAALSGPVCGPAHRVLITLGAASYAIYLFHSLAIDLSWHLRSPLSAWLGAWPELLHWSLIGLRLLLSLLAGWLIYEWLDRPSQRLLTRLGRRSAP